jgi:hypothetical protein
MPPQLGDGLSSAEHGAERATSCVRTKREVLESALRKEQHEEEDEEVGLKKVH